MEWPERKLVINGHVRKHQENSFGHCCVRPVSIKIQQSYGPLTSPTTQCRNTSALFLSPLLLVQLIVWHRPCLFPVTFSTCNRSLWLCKYFCWIQFAVYCGEPLDPASENVLVICTTDCYILCRIIELMLIRCEASNVFLVLPSER